MIALYIKIRVRVRKLLIMIRKKISIMLVFPFIVSCEFFKNEPEYKPTIFDFKICPQVTYIPTDYSHVLFQDHVYDIVAYSDYKFLDEFELVSLNEDAKANITGINPFTGFYKTHYTRNIKGRGYRYYKLYQVRVEDFLNPITKATFKRNNGEIVDVDIGIINKTQTYGDDSGPLSFAPWESPDIFSNYTIQNFYFTFGKGTINSLDKLKINNTYVNFSFSEDLSTLEYHNPYIVKVTIPRDVVDYHTNYGIYTYTLEYHLDGNSYVYQSTVKYNYNNQLEYVDYGDYYWDIYLP